MDNDPLSYEEQQLQIILMNELKKRTLQEERKLKELQDIEYQESLRKDEIQQDIEIEEISLEEMRKIRLQRFDKL
jgi:hypothetical protein